MKSASERATLTRLRLEKTERHRKLSGLEQDALFREKLRRIVELGEQARRRGLNFHADDEVREGFEENWSWYMSLCEKRRQLASAAGNTEALIEVDLVERDAKQIRARWDRLA